MKYLAIAALVLSSSLAQAFIIFEPLPVPTCDSCSSHLSFNQQQQLIALNRPYLPTLNLVVPYCPSTELNNYYRKSDLLPPPVQVVEPAPIAKGAILIIPYHDRRHTALTTASAP